MADDDETIDDDLEEDLDEDLEDDDEPIDLDDDLGRQAHGVAVVARREGPEPRRHRGELGVGQALERLADVREALALADGEVIVREPADAPAGPAVRRDDDAVEGRLEIGACAPV